MADPRQMGEAEREAFHREAEGRVHTFRYERPPSADRPKQLAWLSRDEQLNVAVQVVKEGGENNLHYHAGAEQVYFVLKGRVRFWGVGDALIADLGPGEGIRVPSGTRYRFEKAGDVDLEILQFVAKDPRSDESADRINIEKHKAWMETPELTKYR